MFMTQWIVADQCIRAPEAPKHLEVAEEFIMTSDHGFSPDLRRYDIMSSTPRSCRATQSKARRSVSKGALQLPDVVVTVRLSSDHMF